MWWPHRQAVFMNHCVKPRPSTMPMPGHCPHPGLSTSSCPRLRPSTMPMPGHCPHPGPSSCPRTPTLASTFAELMHYLESMFEVALQSTGEDEEIKFTVSPVTNCENPCSDEPGVHGDSEDAEMTSHHRSCKRAWKSRPECHQILPGFARPGAADDGTCPQGRAEDRGSCPRGRGEDRGTCPRGRGEDRGTCPRGRGEDREMCPRGMEQGPCPQGRGKEQGSCPQGRGKGLPWMWEGFSVDRYAPRRKPAVLQAASEAEPRSGSKVRPGGLFQITPPPDRGGRGLRQQRGGRPRPSESPGSLRQPCGPQSCSLPGGPEAAARAGKWPEGRPKTRRPPSEPGQVDGSGRAERAGAGRPATPPSNRGTVARATSRPIRAAAAAYRRFLTQYRRALETPPGSGGDGGGCPRPQRKAGQQQLKVTKLVEQRHELIRKTIMEKERKELMEQKRLTKQKVKRRKIERQIAARMSVCEMERCRKNQARKRLQSFRIYNRKQAAQYQAELKEMKERVARAPFLFEQVIQDNVRATINRLFTRVLQRLHLDEELMCKLSTEGGGSKTQLIELEGEAGTEANDGEGLCALSRGECQCQAACEEPPNTADCQSKQESDSTNCATGGPDVYW